MTQGIVFIEFFKILVLFLMLFALLSLVLWRQNERDAELKMAILGALRNQDLTCGALIDKINKLQIDRFYGTIEATLQIMLSKGWLGVRYTAKGEVLLFITSKGTHHLEDLERIHE